ncbi:hypothetical protein MAMC_02268 [Methylacidimicrobium cyclopophantes]|uniref:DUF4325 domain-containing protein n=1 Tax=Methylacidimicrobium cyclopophantes TaxID=1041766 RepID=A0A5E6MGD8_9BACT|nr:STAS-like domain-containing protein [Methylacidimicrobium cyclopophantes]VVM08551.1 hypothetical protein MAMC_02268 [Methylacidimicrobium cyclopophantes]
MYGKSPNRGVGLSMLQDLVRQTMGTMVILSGCGWWMQDGELPSESGRLPRGASFGGTVCSICFRRKEIYDFNLMLREAWKVLGLSGASQDSGLFMSHEFFMKELFGGFLADGDLANAFRFNEVESKLGMHALVIFNFEGVTNRTASFANALFGGLAEDHPYDLVEKIRFKNCSPLIRSFLTCALSFGIERGKQLAHSGK